MLNGTGRLHAQPAEERMVDVISLHIPQQWRSSLLHKQTRPRRGCGNSMFSNRTPGVPSFSPWLPPPPWLSPNSPHCPPLISRLVSCVWSFLFQKNIERPIFLMVLWAFLLSRELNSQSHFVSRLLRVLRWNDAAPLMRSSECSTVRAHRPTRKSDSLSESVLLDCLFNESFIKINGNYVHPSSTKKDFER